MAVDAAQPSAGTTFLSGVINNLGGVAAVSNAVKGKSEAQPAASATPGATGAGTAAAVATASPVTTAAANSAGPSTGLIIGIAGGAAALLLLIVLILTGRKR
jgi:hypothetical protein